MTCAGKLAKVWETATGKELKGTSLGGTSAGPEIGNAGGRRGTSAGSEIGNAGFSSDGKLAVVVNGGAWVWNFAAGKETGPFGDELRCAVLTRDGKRLIWGDIRDAMMIDWAENKLIRKFEGHTGRVTCLALSADEKSLFTGSDDKTVRQWDLATGKSVRTFQGHEQGIISVVISSDAKTLITAGKDNTVRVWGTG